MIVNGWEFYILNPFDENIKQTTQDKYIEMYNKAYDIFIRQLCIPEPNDILEYNFDFIYYIDISGDNDKIDLGEYYDYTFLKSVFINKKIKNIRNDVLTYYNFYNINVSNMYKQDNSFYVILNRK